MITQIKIFLVLVLTIMMVSCTDYFFAVDVNCVSGGTAQVIEVVDQDNNPITGADFTVINTRTGKEFCVDLDGNKDESCYNSLGETGSTAGGEYVLISAYNTRNNQPTADVRHFDVIEAIITKSGVIAKSKYIVIFDNDCFPERVEGPEVVVLEMPQ